MDWIPQIGIVFTGCSAAWLVSRREQWKKWGYLLGLCGQPFWVWTSINNEQWGILALSVWYTYAWGQGVWNYIVREYKN